MAYTKVFAIRARLDDRVKYAVNGEKTELDERIVYTADPEKTDTVRFVTTLNCRSAETAFAAMQKTKKKYKKTGGVLGYHFIQSFAPGEVTPEQAHEIGCEFARRLFGEDFEAVIGTHLDKAHPHNHIVVNSVSRTDGHKYAYEDGMNLFQWMGRFSQVLERPFSIGWTPYTLKCMLGSLLLYGCGVALYYSSRENRRPGEEYGSAKWGDPKELNRKYMNHQHKEANIILTQHVRLGMDGYITQRNMNVLVVGGSGSGKTRFFCKPNIYSANCSYLITDPKGELLRAAGALLAAQGYEVRVFNLIDPSQSDGYNPFSYIHSEKDVLSLIDNLIKNTTPRNASSNDPFWEKAEIALDSALMLYLVSEAPPEEQNFEMLIYMMNFAEVREEDEQYRSPLDMLFRALEEEQPAHAAVKQYKVFKQAAGKTAKSILVTAAVRLAAFNIPQYAAMTSMDEMDFGSLGERKRAIFCVIPVNDSSMNYLVGMLYTQCFQELYRRADLKYNGRLPVPVRVLQDEWANVAQPESYPKILATCRSYNIGLNIIVQNIQQIKALYEKEHESIIGNCDTLLFLGGGNEPASLEFIVKLLGRETLATRTRGLTKGRNGSSNTNYQQTGRDLMTIDEVRKLDTHKAILFIRGEDPVLDKKYNIKRHPNIKLTTDGKAKPYIHKPLGAPDYALPDLPYAFKSLDDYDFIDVEEPEHELSEKEKDFKPDKTE